VRDHAGSLSAITTSRSNVALNPSSTRIVARPTSTTIAIFFFTTAAGTTRANTGACELELEPPALFIHKYAIDADTP
jgi:hypothetical protein